ncbi:MAG: transporter substrate-binding domain-containing protein [Desulfovibrio sp.]|jgi:signal transduction histidine kinase/CheY-like chemotaxis protein|nr:transporter substrate-binding domain-containing protein [Desulfovibrio sp.]
MHLKKTPPGKDRVHAHAGEGNLSPPYRPSETPAAPKTRGRSRARRTAFFFIVVILLPLLYGAAVVQGAAPILTEAEKEFIRKHPVIRVGINPNFAPFEFLDNWRNYAGIAPDYLALISEKTGLRFAPAVEVPYTETQEKVRAGELDLLPALDWTAEWEKEFLLTQRYYEYKPALVVREDSPFKSVEEFRGRPLAVQKNTANVQFAFSTLQAGLSLYASEEDALLAVTDGRETAMLGYLPAVLHAIRKLGLPNLNYITFASGNSNGLCMGVRTDLPELRDILNKALAAVTPSEKAAIHSRWIHVSGIGDAGEKRRIRYLAGASAALLLAMAAFIVLKIYSHRKRIALHRQNECILQSMVRQRTEDLQNQTRLAVEASHAKSAFLATMSHEIRSPMNVVVGLAEVLLRRELPPDVAKEVRYIRQAGVSLLSIINDILDFSKIEAGKITITDEEYAFRDLIRDVEDIIRFRISDKPVDFIVRIDAWLPDRLRGDMNRVRQVLLNLLGNAVKYTRLGSVTLTVIGAMTANDKVRLFFEVADTGIGIRREDMDALFNSFGRVDVQSHPEIEGTGLGLTIARSLCRAMDGDVTATSEYGKGSVFTAALLQRVVERRLQSVSVAQEKTRTVTFTAPEAEVLIVDDLPGNLLVAEGLLAPYRMRLFTCANGREAVDLVTERPFDLVLMDHMMPVMGGVEAMLAIRALNEARCRTMPVVALTADAVSGMREMFLENGFNDFLSKPVDVDRLDTVLRQWIPACKRISVPEDGSGL